MRRWTILSVLGVAAVSAALLGSCFNSDHAMIEKKSSGVKPIGKQTVHVADGLLTPEVMWQMGRVGGLRLAPDGRSVLYRVQYYDVPSNKGNADLYRIPLAGEKDPLPTPEQVTHTAESESDAQWSPDGAFIYFLSPASGSMQLYRMRADGSHRTRISHVEGGMEAFSLSPDGKHVLYVATVPYGQDVHAQYPDLPLTSGRIVTDLMYKHWDEWVDRIPHPFVASLQGGRLTSGRDLLQDEPFESPMRPFGGMEQLAWSPDSRQVLYTCRKKTGTDYALSTHSDIYCYDIAANTMRKLTPDPASPARIRLLPDTGDLPQRAGRQVTTATSGYNQNPVFSPDGRYVAFESMERDGYESDWNRLWVYDSETDTFLWLATALDGDVSSVCWGEDSRTIYFISAVESVSQVFRTDVMSGEVEQLTDGMYDMSGLIYVPRGTDRHATLLALRQSMLRPAEICRIDAVTGDVWPLTDENAGIFAQLKMPRVRKYWIKTQDGQDMLTWVVLPPDFDETRAYPSVLFCPGGPQGANGQFWSYRWNLCLMASRGYVVILPNRRGVSGMGQAWKEQISRDYPGKNMQDYLDAADALALEPFVDANRMGCVGASYGGYSVYWLAGHHQHRFKAFIAHSGIFNAEAQYLETDEMWFENWDAGAFWDREDASAQRYYASSPHLFADQWDTPILCIHGERDYRILASQGMQAFNAARLRGVPAELLVFPDEGHWILKPQNAILWQRTFFGWLDRWLGDH